MGDRIFHISRVDSNRLPTVKDGGKAIGTNAAAGGGAKLRATRKKINLYSLIKRQGRMTLLEYALESGFGAQEARAYLESRSSRFWCASSSPSRAETIYQFPTGER